MGNERHSKKEVTGLAEIDRELLNYFYETMVKIRFFEQNIENIFI